MIISNNRNIPPKGLNGGGDALCGENLLKRANGESEVLASSQEVSVRKGDIFTIKTPGGGGYGKY